MANAELVLLLPSDPPPGPPVVPARGGIAERPILYLRAFFAARTFADVTI